MASLAEALEVDCPECGQLAGTMCVYMPVAMADSNSRKSSVQARLTRIGKPTQRAHNRRLRYASRKKKQCQEYDKLRCWLAAYGSELFGA
jgi:hypothetical protein